MVGLFKSLFTLAVIAGILYLVFFVTFGDKTLYQHMVGISETREAKTLGHEVEKKFRKTKKEVRRELKNQLKEFTADDDRPAGKAASRSEPDPVEHDGPSGKHAETEKEAEHSNEDRQALKQLFTQKLRAATSSQD